MRRECRERFSRHRLQKGTARKRSRHASWHVRHARAMMHVRIANPPNVPGIPGACATRNFAYLVRGPLGILHVITLRPKQNGRHLADDIFQCISVNVSLSSLTF